jgi:hypothetical protein
MFGLAGNLRREEWLSRDGGERINDLPECLFWPMLSGCDTRL